MDLDIANDEVADRAGGNAVRVGAPAGRIQRVVQQHALDGDVRRVADIEQIAAASPHFGIAQREVVRLVRTTIASSKPN